MEKIFNLPAHPLFVHFPIVLLPIAAVGALALLLRPQWRATFSWPLAVATLIGMISTILASKSGQPFEDAIGPLGNLVDKHERLGEQTEVLSIFFFLSAFAMAVISQLSAKRGPIELPGISSGNSVTVEQGQTWARAATALNVLVALLGILVTIWVIRTGHEGARITWGGVFPE